MIANQRTINDFELVQIAGEVSERLLEVHVYHVEIFSRVHVEDLNNLVNATLHFKRSRLIRLRPVAENHGKERIEEF